MKNQVRRELIKLRNSLSKKEVFKKSDEIKKKLFDLSEFILAAKILFYVSYGNEVYTHDMIKESISKKKNVIVPIIDKKNKRLILSELIDWNDLESGAYNILEPKVKKIKEIILEEIELIIVPGLGFDEDGNRIGHGKGYYDNLLRKSQNIPHIGLAFESQIAKEIPTNSYDIPVDIIITDKRIINCKN